MFTLSFESIFFMHFALTYCRFSFSRLFINFVVVPLEAEAEGTSPLICRQSQVSILGTLHLSIESVSVNCDAAFDGLLYGSDVNIFLLGSNTVNGINLLPKVDHTTLKWCSVSCRF